MAAFQLGKKYVFLASFYYHFSCVFLRLFLLWKLFFLFEQANVYHATKADGGELAIKVFKTSILVFK